MAAAPLFHLIDPNGIDRDLLDDLCALTTRVRTLAKHPDGARFLLGLLPDRRAMLYFVQPSTRTFLSFNNACHILGIRTSEIRDASTSSEVKGESFEDSIRTFSSYVDVIVMRTPEAGQAARAAALMNRIPRPVPIIKMGDLRRGRTVRSLCHLLQNYRGVRVVFIAPPQYAMGDDVKAHLRNSGIPYVDDARLADVIGDLDALYVTRMQTEWDTDGDATRIDYADYGVGPANVGRLKPDAVIMHPLPRGPEIHPSVDDDPRAMYWRQERNGMWMRVAILLKIFQADRFVHEVDLDALTRN